MQALRARLEEVLQIRETQAEMAELLGSQAGSSLVRCSAVSLCDNCTLQAKTARCLGCVRSHRSGDLQTHSPEQMSHAWCGIEFGTLLALQCLLPVIA